MNRRDVIKLLSLAGLATICPLGLRGVRADEPKYGGPYWIMLNAGGGWDPTILCDPKGGNWTPDPNDPTKGTWSDDSVNHFEKIIDVGPFKAGDARWADDFGAKKDVELYSSEHFLTDHGDRILVVNGVDTTTNNHEVGSRVTWSGRTNEGQPALAALIAAFGASGKDLPLAYMSSGGYDNTAGVIPLARAESDPRVVTRVAYPNIINVENIGNDKDPAQSFFSNDTASRIQAAQAERLKALQDVETLPGVRTAMGSLLLARAGVGSLGSLADELSKVDPVTVPSAFPDQYAGLDDNAFGGDFRDLLAQAQLCLHSFHAGVAVAANLNIGGFDTHSNHDNDQTRQMMKLLKAFDYIWRLAKDIGIDNNLYVVVGSDFGRTPYYNKGNGKDHWNVTSMILSGPQIVGGRVIGATDAGFKPMKVDPNDTSKVLEDSDGAGVRIECSHVHRELRRAAGMLDSDLDKAWGLPGNGINLLG
jgi:hypothetical protein